MAQLNLNLGTPPAGTDGDRVRQAFEKVQANFTELYQTKQDGIEGLTPAGISFLQAGDSAGQRNAIGLGNVDNTSDADKPVSTAQQAALDGKQDTLTAGGNITIIDNVISSTGGGSGSTEWGSIGGNLEDQIDLQNALNAKVDTVAGKGLSTNDFTDDDKARLDAGTDIAQGNRTGSEVVITSSTGVDATLSSATTTLAGVMSAADKSKVDAIPTNTDGLTEGPNNLYFTAARVRSTLLTGLAAGTSAVIAATDTILQALAKLQAQIASSAGGLAFVYPNGGSASAPANVSLSTRYVLPNPFPGQSVVCEAQILIGGVWYNSGWYTDYVSVSRSYGVRASQVGDEIIVQCGRNALATSGVLSGGGYTGSDVTSPVPGRVRIWKTGG